MRFTITLDRARVSVPAFGRGATDLVDGGLSSAKRIARNAIRIAKGSYDAPATTGAERA